MKSKLQLRAENALKQFRAQSRAPIVIEFAGLPKAGKTSTLSQAHAFFRRCGFRTEIVVERASVCPIKDKKHFNFNVWTACTTLAQLLEKTQVPQRADDPDILILDRGVFDSICWFEVMRGLCRLRSEDKEKIEKFLLCGDWRSRISGVILMTADPSDSLDREKGYLPVEGTGGSVMNAEVLRHIRTILEDTASRLRNYFRIFSVNTSAEKFKNSPQATCEAVANKILDWIEEDLEENILSLEKAAVTELLGSRNCIDRSGALRLVQQFGDFGQFLPRTRVEADMSRIQALPVVVVRNATGKILLLFRKERKSGDVLHNNFLIWAGGHVRREDASAGARLAIITGALRELQEELRLSIEPDALTLKGAVYFDDGRNASKHVAIVYEWHAQTNDVEIALCNSEFIERHGNSLRGSFVTRDDVLATSNLEEWSRLIAENLLTASA